MSFYNTGNPVPSIDPRDLDDNAKHIDEIVNSTFTTFVDRTGATRLTLAGIEAEAADVVIFTQEGAGSVPVAGSTKLGERMSITDKGAIGDGVTNCAQAIIDAASSTAWDIYVPRGNFVATVNSGNATAIFGALNRIKLDGDLTLNIVSGTIALTAQVVINSPDAHRLKIIGATPVATTATSQVSVSGSAKAYSVTIGVASSAGAAIGDYAKVFQNLTGTGDFYAHAGTWRITAVDSGGANRLTLLNTHHGAAFPTNTLTGGTVRILKTVLDFAGCDGFRCENAQPGLIDNMAVKGDWNVAAATGTTGCHGFITASPLIAGGGDSNAIFEMAGNFALGQNVGVVCFGEQGIAISGRGGMIANYVSSCSNRKRGIYGEGSHIRAKFAVTNGNGEDGVISDNGATVQVALSIASGNGLNGFWNTANSYLAAATSVASGNLANGFEARGAGRLSADVAIALNNALAGFSASDGGMIDADSASAIGNGAHGFDAVTGMIDADNSVSTGNTGYGFRAQIGSEIRASGATVSGNTTASYLNRESIIIDSAGNSVPQDTPTYTVGQRFYNALKTLYYAISITSLGDLVFTSGATSRLILKTDGTLHPSADGTQPCGRTTEKWSQVNAVVGLYTGPVKCGQYTLATLPSASTFNGYEIDVTDATGGSKRCRSNGTVWQILNTTTTVS